MMLSGFKENPIINKFLTLFSGFSLKGKILLWVMPIAILGMLSISFTAYKYVNIVIEKELSDSMLISVGKSAESIDRWLSTIMLEPESIASTPAAKRINQDFLTLDIQNINRHKILHAKHPDIFQDIYAANRQGEYHTVQQNDSGYSLFVGDIANRPYFQSIMAGGPTQITPPLISRTTGIPTIFMVSPIVDEANQPQGLIGAGISLKYIQQIGQELKAGQDGYGFIVAKDGTYIYHPDSDFVMKRKITELDDPLEAKLGQLMLSGGSGMYYSTVMGRTMIAFYQPIPVTGWSAATVIPESELFAPTIKMMKVLTVITTIFVFFIGTAILLAMQLLTRPLQTLAKRTQEIADGNLEGDSLEITSKDEIGSLAESFNKMTANLKKTLSGLQKSEESYRSIFENSIEGILQSTIEGEVLNANPAMAKMLGYASAEELIGAHLDLNQDIYVNPDDRQTLLSQILRKGMINDFEVQYRRRDNEIIWVSLSSFLVRNASGEPLRIEGMVANISDRKRGEQERRKLFEQLAQAQKLEAVGQLAGGVAHDFNNMLSVIIGQTQLALLRVQPSDPFYKPFVEIQNAAEHSANLTKQLLAFARKQTVAPKMIDLNQAINDTLTLLRRLISEDIELVLHSAAEVWPIFIDPDQIKQILTNLCVNARDAIAGIGQINIETKNVSFDADYCANYPDVRPGDYVSLTVSDTGSGMDKETQKHIFEPFFTTKEVVKGTGLGLATVYGIVKQNNAFINIYSEPGQGTIFRLYFPRCQDVHQTSSPKALEKLINIDMGTVLLVEDEPRILTVTKQILEELGCRVVAVKSPSEALKIAEDPSYSIDLLITDVVMPEMNGRELALRVATIRPDIRCLFMSGYTADIIAHKGVLDEGVNFIQKPFTVQNLVEKINEVMQ